MDAVLHEDDFLALSDGQKLPSLKSFRKTQAKLANVSKRKAARKQASNRRRKLAKREARIDQPIARSRQDRAFLTAHKVVRTGKKVFFHENLDLKNLTKRNKPKQDKTGKFVPNGQSASSGLNKSWNDAAFGAFFKTLEYIAEKAGAKVVAVKPNHTSQFLSYRDEKIFTDCEIREYWHEIEQLLVDRDINAAVNIKRVGLGLFLTLNSRSGKIKVSLTSSTAMEVLRFFRGLQKPTLTRQGSVW